LVGTEAAEDEDFVLGAGDGDVEAASAAVAVEGAEVHGDFAGFVGGVADGEEDDVAFVALDVFEVFDEEGFAFDGWVVAKVGFDFGVFAAFFVEEVLDELLLGEAEGDDAVGAGGGGGVEEA